MNHYVYLSSTDYHEEPHESWKQRLYAAFNKREDFKQENTITFIDPIQYSSSSPAVVSADVQNLNLCDIVVFYIHDVSIGTVMELAYCALDRARSRSLYLISDNEKVVRHPWIRNLVERTPNSQNNAFFTKLTLCDNEEDAVAKIISDKTDKGNSNINNNNNSTRKQLINEAQ